MNKKYQMMVDNIQANLYHYDQNKTHMQFNFSFSHAQLSRYAELTMQS